MGTRSRASFKRAQQLPAPLFQLLREEATRRGHSLKALSYKIGVTYRQLAHWRDGTTSMADAGPDVLTNAARYLGVSRIVVLANAGIFGVRDFEQPSPLPRKILLHRAMEEMKQDIYIGPFVPGALGKASDDVQTFVAFLYRQIQRNEWRHHASWVQDAMSLLASPHVTDSSQDDKTELF